MIMRFSDFSSLSLCQLIDKLFDRGTPQIVYSFEVSCFLDCAEKGRKG